MEDNFFQKFDDVKRILNINMDWDDVFTDNQNFINQINKKIDDKSDEIQRSHKRLINYPDWLKDIDARSQFGELINYVIDYLGDNSEINDVELFNTIRKDIDDTNHYNDDTDELLYSDDQVYKAIEASKIIINNNLYYENGNDEMIIADFKTNLRLFDNYSLSNIYRQIFINIFSIFDAYVYDNFKVYFRNNINELEVFFNPNNSKSDELKFSFKELLEFNDIESVYNTMIEARLNGKYLSNIMRLLNKYKEDFFDKSLSLGDLLEAINRRNIHVHKKGIVDKKYLNDTNPYSFNEGDIAYISRDYLFHIFKILTSFDHNLHTLVKEGAKE